MSHQKYQSCIDACNACATECGHCANACLNEEDVKKLVRCIQLDQDCADICSLASKLMANGSEFAQKFCAFCAEVCQACGDECKKHAEMMEHCKRCADACYQCAEACRAMSK